MTFAVTVNTPDTGDHRLDNFVVPTGTPPPSECLPANTACTTHPVPALVVTKSAVPSSTTVVNEGDVVTYTLTFANTAGQAPATVNHADDLSRVLDDATVTTPPTLASGTGLTVSPISGGAFTVTGTVGAGATATVTFAVTVNTPDTGDHRLDNFVVPTGTTPPSECLPTDPACTTHPVPALVVTKSAVPSSTTVVNEGDVVTYTLTFANTAGQAPATVNHADDLSGVLDDATLTTPPTVASGTGLTVGAISGGAFTVTGTVAAGATATVTFSVTVNTPDTGDHQLDNFVVPTGTPPPSECLPTDPACTTHPVPALVVTKSAVPSSTTVVNEGDVLTYTLTFANTAGRAPAPVDHTDDLSGVLDDATVTTSPALASGSGLTVGAISGTTFTVTGAVPAGQTATVTFSVTVNEPDTGDHQLDNFVVTTGTTPPSECLPTDPTCTTHPVPALVVTKSAVPSSTTVVNEGDVLTYTLTFANTAGRAPAPVDHTDDLSRVLDDATVTTPPALASGSGLTVGAISGTTFTVTGAVPAGQTATVTFSVTVNEPDTGDHQLDNFVVPTGTPPPSECLPTDPTCTTHPVPALVVTKSSEPPSTTPVSEGQVLVYTLTFSNTEGRAPATVDHTDDLSRVLDDATVTSPPTVASGTGLTVGPITGGAFTVTGTVAAGETATVAFSVTVGSPLIGDRQLDNFVIPTGDTPPPECLPTDPACTTHPAPALAVTKSAVPSSTTVVNEGDMITYTLTFTNTRGRAPALVNHTDDLSAVLDDASVTTPPALASGSGLTVGAVTGEGTFTITGAVAAGATATVTFAVTVNTPDTGDHVLDNFLVPTGTTPPTECLPTDPTCTTHPVPAIAIDKTSSATLITPGAEVPYTLTVTNSGPIDATAVVVTDVLPVGLSFVSSVPPCTASGQTVTCNLGTVATLASATIEIVTSAAEPFPPDAVDASGNVVNTARVTAPGTNCAEGSTDPDCDDDHPLPLVPTITIVKSSSVTRITPGSTVPYTFTVTNVSAAPATDVVVTDPLPVGLTFVSSPSGCTADAAQVVICSTPTLAPGEDIAFDIVTQAADPFPDTAIDPDGMVPNTATVTSPNTNCVPEPPEEGAAPDAGAAALTADLVAVLQAAEGCESTHPLPVPPTIAITKTSTATALAPGGEVPYVITVTNTGLVVARDVVVTDDLPMGLTFLSSVPSCTAAGQLVTCPLGELARGASATIDLVTRAADPFPTESLVNGEIVNVAVVSGTASNCDEGSTDPVCTDDWAIPPIDPVAPPASTQTGSLPFTGSTLVWLLEVGIVALAGGALLMLRSRRRRMTRRARRAMLRP